jgi:hypothetical protein
MAKGQRLKPEQTVTLLRQIDVLTTNGKTLAQPLKKWERSSKAPTVGTRSTATCP